MSIPTPYWQSDDGTVTLYHGDCLAILPHLSGVDAAITDPPYGVGFKYESHDDKRDGYPEWCRTWFAPLRSVAATVAITCGQANIAMWSTIEPPKWWLAWWKPAAMGRCVVGFNNWEPIAVYGELPRAMCDVIRSTINPDRDLDGHPCPKPLGWAKKQVESMTEPDATILDPFMGSGTTGVACVRTGRKFIGIEIEERYCAIAKRRIQEAFADQALYAGVK